MPEGKGTYGSKVGRPKKNPGDVQRKSASERTREKLKNIAKWKTKTPGGTKAPPTDSDEGFKRNWRDKIRPIPEWKLPEWKPRKIDPRYLLGGGGISSGAKKLKDLLKRSGAGYSGSDGYEK